MGLPRRLEDSFRRKTATKSSIAALFHSNVLREALMARVLRSWKGRYSRVRRNKRRTSLAPLSRWAPDASSEEPSSARRSEGAG